MLRDLGGCPEQREKLVHKEQLAFRVQPDLKEKLVQLEFKGLLALRVSLVLKVPLDLKEKLVPLVFRVQLVLEQEERQVHKEPLVPRGPLEQLEFKGLLA